MKSDVRPFKIYGNTVKPGTFSTIILPMPKLYDWTPLTMPVYVVHGKTPGPVLCITAAVHGDEVNGIEVVRRLLKKIMHKKNMAGTVIAIPIVNAYGFLHQDRYLMDRRDLNRAFPGSQKGSLASRLAHLLTSEILSKATHIIDLHSGSLYRSNLPQIRANVDQAIAGKLAESFNVPVILNAAERDGSMRAYANSKKITYLLYEAGEALRFDELSIKTGVDGILRVMHELGISVLKRLPAQKLIPAYALSSYWVRAPYSGIFRPTKALGKKIIKGELLAKINNPTGLEEHDLISPTSGIIIGKTNVPMVHEGAALFHIACFDEDLKAVAEQIEYLQEPYNETSEYLDNTEGE